LHRKSKNVLLPCAFLLKAGEPRQALLAGFSAVFAKTSLHIISKKFTI
jgi:hypothetical protein